MKQRTWAMAEQPAQRELHLHFVFKEQIFFQIIPSFMTPEVLTPNGTFTSQSQTFGLYFLGLALLNTKHGVQKSMYEYEVRFIFGLP